MTSGPHPEPSTKRRIDDALEASGIMPDEATRASIHEIARRFIEMAEIVARAKPSSAEPPDALSVRGARE